MGSCGTYSEKLLLRRGVAPQHRQKLATLSDEPHVLSRLLRAGFGDDPARGREGGVPAVRPGPGEVVRQGRLGERRADEARIGRRRLPLAVQRRNVFRCRAVFSLYGLPRLLDAIVMAGGTFGDRVLSLAALEPEDNHVFRHVCIHLGSPRPRSVSPWDHNGPVLLARLDARPPPDPDQWPDRRSRSFGLSPRTLGRRARRRWPMVTR